MSKEILRSTTRNLIRPAADVIENNRRESRTISQYTFPSDIGKHSTVLNFKTYSYADTNNVNSILRDSIILPLPDGGFVDDIDLAISSTDLGLMGSALAGGAVTLGSMIQTGSQQSFLENLRAVAGSVGGAIEDRSIGDLLMSGGRTVANLMRSLGKDFGWGAGIDAFVGNTQNPYATATFRGVTVQSKTLSWTLSPKSRAESVMLNNIINKIKRASLPEYESVISTSTGEGIIDNSYLKYPDLVDIFYTGIDQDFFVRHQTSMVKSVSASYEGDSFYSGESGSRPVSITLTIGLEEVQIRTRDDYDG